MISQVILPLYTVVAVFVLIAGAGMYFPNKAYTEGYYLENKKLDHERMLAKIGARLIFSFLLWPLLAPLAIYYGIKALTPHIKKLAKDAA